MSALSNRCSSIAVVAGTLLLCASLVLTPVARAAGEADNAADEGNVSELQQKVEDTADAYNEASARVDDLNAQVSDTETRIADLEAQLPQQHARCEEAVRKLYLYQQQRGNFVGMLLGAQSFSDFVNIIEYFDRLNSYNHDAIQATTDMEADLKASKASLDQSLADAQSVKTNAANALADAQAAREVAAQAAIQQAQTAAEQQAQAAAAAANTSSGNPSGNTVTNPGDINWATDKTAFVNAWAPRIDSYLSGSPMAGCGTDYAAAAWDYGVDPRFAPAISSVESSKGAVCYRSYNAWGYGGRSYGSWSEGIYNVVRGLAIGYGGNLSYEGASRYDPSDPGHWYNAVSAQMGLI